jgi:hypothetical protein
LLSGKTRPLWRAKSELWYVYFGVVGVVLVLLLFLVLFEPVSGLTNNQPIQTTCSNNNNNNCYNNNCYNNEQTHHHQFQQQEEKSLSGGGGRRRSGRYEERPSTSRFKKESPRSNKRNVPLVLSKRMMDELLRLEEQAPLPRPPPLHTPATTTAAGGGGGGGGCYMSEQAIKAALEAVQAPISRRSCSFFAKHDSCEEEEEQYCAAFFKSRWNRDDDDDDDSSSKAWASHCAKRMKIVDDDVDEGEEVRQWNNKRCWMEFAHYSAA